MQHTQIRNTTFTALIMLPALLHAQEAFRLDGKIGLAAPGSKVYLNIYKGNSKLTDSAEVKANGQFQFSGSIQQPTMSALRLHHGGSKSPAIDEVIFYLDKGQTHVSTTDSMYKAVIKGSKTTDEFMELGKMVKAVEKENGIWQVNAGKNNVNNEDRVKQYKAFRQQRAEAFKTFIKANPQSQVSLDAIKDVSGPVTDIAVAGPLFNGLSDAVKNTPAGKEFAAQLFAQGNVSVGSAAPLFSQPDTKGKMISLEAYRGKYVLIDFWASWCGPCRAENPNVLAQYEKYKNKNFDVLAVSIDEKRDSWIKAIGEDKLPWTQVSDLRGFSGNEAALKYGIKVIPQNFLVDPQGKIIAKNLRGKALEDTLKTLFN